jgi:hypothetical protein
MLESRSLTNPKKAWKPNKAQKVNNSILYLMQHQYWKILET